MDWKSALAGFMCILAAACVVPFMQPGEQNIPPEQPAIVVQVATTNDISTNMVDRANQNQKVDWFKQSSSYIWDGWKIK